MLPEIETPDRHPLARVAIGYTAGALAVSLVVAVMLRMVHDSIFAYGGAFVIIGTVGGAALFTWQSVRRAQREAASATVSSVVRSEVLPSR